MLKNYIKIAFRNVLKHKGYSLINVFGLSIGIACCLLIFMYVNDELTYDRFHTKGDRIYRIINKLSFGGNEMVINTTSSIEGKTFAEEVPEIEGFTRIDNASGIVHHNDDYIDESGFLYADKGIFELFDFEVIQGDLSTALDGLNSIVLTESMAQKYFNSTDVIGEFLRARLDSEFESYQVSAVIADHPSNSSFNFEMVLPWAKLESTRSPESLNSWTSLSVGSFLMLRADADPLIVEQKMQTAREGHHPDSTSFARKINSHLQNLFDIHLDSEYGGGAGLGESSDPTYSYVLSGIALLILIIACINFTNLSVAQSIPRAKEIGVRKVVGALKKQLAYQFLMETFLMCIVAFVFGMILAEFLIPLFGQLTNKKFNVSLFSSPVLLISSFVIVLITAFVSGAYPAFVVSRFNVIRCLRGSVSLSGKRYVTKGLVVAQFAIATVLIIGALTMRNQISHMVNKDVGYEDEYLYEVRGWRLNEESNILNLFKGELEGNPNIEMVSGSTGYGSAISILVEEGNEFLTSVTELDENYLTIKEIELLRGRELTKGRDRYIDGEDTLRNILVNETFVNKMEWEDGVGERIGGYRVVGVVKDYHFSNVRSQIGPLLLTNLSSDDSWASQLYIKFRPEYLPEIKGTLEATWRKFVPYFPFEADLVSDMNQNMYKDESRWNEIISWASSLAIFISCMGLLGLAHLGTQQRSKEIGIRKVLGASVGQIILLLNTNFMKLVTLSIFIGAPIAFFAVDEWLSNFASRINVSILLLFIPGIVTFTIAFLTVSLQSLKSANANPVDSLRYE